MMKSYEYLNEILNECEGDNCPRGHRQLDQRRKSPMNGNVTCTTSMYENDLRILKLNVVKMYSPRRGDLSAMEPG